MRFGVVPVGQALGAILAHSQKVGSGRLRKGMVLDPTHVSALEQHGLTEITVARLDPGDIDENAAAAQLAQALVPDPDRVGLRLTKAFTGRVNIVADGPGLVDMDVAELEQFNRVHPMITIATVPPYQQMAKGGLVATIKIIAYAVPGADVTRASTTAPRAIRLSGPVHQSASLIITTIPGGPSNDKGVRAISTRVQALGMKLQETITVAHETDALARAIQAATGDILLILTGSATSDDEDVGPSALRRAGGRLERFGMPVDPGNLLFLGSVAKRPLIGLPGCARSPALNGADWVLGRVACGIEVTGDDIAGMGVGGLLKEIPTRPQPRVPVKN